MPTSTSSCPPLVASSPDPTETRSRPFHEAARRVPTRHGEEPRTLDQGRRTVRSPPRRRDVEGEGGTHRQLPERIGARRRISTVRGLDEGGVVRASPRTRHRRPLGHVEGRVDRRAPQRLSWRRARVRRNRGVRQHDSSDGRRHHHRDRPARRATAASSGGGPRGRSVARVRRPRRSHHSPRPPSREGAVRGRERRPHGRSDVRAARLADARRRDRTGRRNPTIAVGRGGPHSARPDGRRAPRDRARGSAPTRHARDRRRRVTARTGRHGTRQEHVPIDRAGVERNHQGAADGPAADRRDRQPDRRRDPLPGQDRPSPDRLDDRLG